MKGAKATLEANFAKLTDMANEIQPRFESFYNLGLLLKFKLDGGLRPVGLWWGVAGIHT